ncbi:MAG: AAA family ATPase, partial [Actinomycetota bacterium]|nr:AAA family ATPase [Actinomycetota bacterium]
PPDASGGGWELSLPLANRFCHLEWEVSPHEVARGLALGWQSVPDGTSRAADPDREAPNVTSSLGAIGAFLHTRPDLVLVVPPSQAHEGGFPSPRSWEMAARLHAVARSRRSPPSVLRALVAGCVGLGAASELLYYLDHLDVPLPETVLADPEAWEIPVRHGDLVYATVTSVTSLAASLATAAAWEAAGIVLARVAEAGLVDVAYHASRSWIRQRPEGALPAARTLLALRPLLVSAPEPTETP